jgi:tetratricopeptide (TPR) repeat protein
VTAHRRLPAALALAVAAASCAGSAPLPPTPPPAEIPALEATLASDPGDIEAGLRLAAAYRGVDRVPAARAVVDTLLVSFPDDPGLLLMAGVLAEDDGDLAGARTAYSAALESDVSGAVRDEVERRVELVRRDELRAEVRSALAREAELTQREPPPGTVAVFPFLYEGSDPSWEPLALALPEMLATDLGVTGRLQVLERVRIQALIDEMVLGVSGRVAEETAARTGRLLGSRNVVQGRFRIEAGDRIGLDAAVVEVGAAGQVQVDPLTDEDALDQLFALEKRLALNLHEEMGVQLTPAERERINERQTESVQALLELGRGIAAENAGDFGQAREHYDAAGRIDPGFALAQQHAARVARLVTLVDGALASSLVDGARRLALQRDAVRLLRNAPAAARNRILADLNPQQRAVLAEVLGQDRIGQVILLELVFTQPGVLP